MNNELQSNQNIHIYEPGGRGGVYQHSLAVSSLLTKAGRTVTLHTTAAHEITDPSISYCTCVRWTEYKGGSRYISRGLRMLAVTIPHLLNQRGLIWIQGTFRTPLTLLLIVLLRLLRKRNLFSPHNLFSRHGGRLDQLLVNLCVRNAGALMTYNKTDQARLSRAGLPSLRTHLFAYAPVISPETSLYWQTYVTRKKISVCSVGQVRTDKNLPMLITAANNVGLNVAIMGADTGGLPELRATSRRLNLDDERMLIGFFALEDMAALIAACGLVALPYSVASQSGVAALAQAYGAKVIARRVGGLSEQVDYLVDTLEEEEWSRALAHATAEVSQRSGTIRRLPLAVEGDALHELMAALESLVPL